MSIWGRLFLQHSLLLLQVLGLAATNLAKSGCKESCWNLTSIPYPFGIGPDCYREEQFQITCNDTVQKAFWQDTDIEVSSISLNRTDMIVMQYIAKDCYNSSGARVQRHNPTLSLPRGFKVSTNNKFTAVGCDTNAHFHSNYNSYTSGCISTCNSPELITNGSCSGIGCCETSIPLGVSYYRLTVDSFNKHENISDFNPCSYAFVADKATVNFSFDSFANLANVRELPVVLDWVIGNQTCDEAKNLLIGYACQKKNGGCKEAQNGPGYQCSCLEGYQGNPYLPDGCQDIDECKTAESHACGKHSQCVNNIGNYTCECAKGYQEDGGRNCTRDQLPVLLIPICTAGGITLIFLSIAWFYFGLKKRELIKLREKFFQQNGGLMLQEKLSGHRRTKDTVRVFSEKELKSATNNYDESRIIGKGGFGTVYKGILADDTVVAIKKSQVVDEAQVEQFVNEVVVLSQINHRNVVRLLGCCLETQVPLLVYEFISNGTLHDHIHDKFKAALLSWEIRVKIAAETAGVLSYLHTAANTPIIHRDMKPTNILLDEKYTAKVSDFGASRLVPVDESGLCTLVKGTTGYVDPEYLQTCQLTEKSDVYSFGIVLVELLTGKKALCFQRPEKDRNLAMYFLRSMNESRFFQIADDRLLIEENDQDQVMDVAKLATKCLKVKGEERPSMKEVAMELEGIMRLMKEKHPWVESNLNWGAAENKYLLGENSGDYGHDQSMAGYDSARMCSLGSGP